MAGLHASGSREVGCRRGELEAGARARTRHSEPNVRMTGLRSAVTANELTRSASRKYQRRLRLNFKTGSAKNS